LIVVPLDFSAKVAKNWKKQVQKSTFFHRSSIGIHRYGLPKRIHILSGHNAKAAFHIRVSLDRLGIECGIFFALVAGV
jgi:hypothetical protein